MRVQTGFGFVFSVLSFPLPFILLFLFLFLFSIERPHLYVSHAYRNVIVYRNNKQTVFVLVILYSKVSTASSLGPTDQALPLRSFSFFVHKMGPAPQGYGERKKSSCL